VRFYEFEAKRLLAKHGVRLPQGGTAGTPEEAAALAAEVGGPIVLKSQVLTGGRMKAGGIKFAGTPEEAKAAAEAILSLEIRGQRPRCVLVEAKAAVAKEYFAAVTYDALAKLPVMIFSDMGGIDIEQVAEEHPEHIARAHLSTLLPPAEFEIRGAQIDAQDHRGVAGRVVEFEGNLGLVIGAGGGSLTIFDAIRKYGGRPANYCEIGGNPSVAKAAALTKLILSKPGVDKIAVIMNVVSNTRVDIVARGVVKGVVESGFDPAEKIAIFRIPGSWEGEGFKILAKYGVEFCDRTVSMSEAARRAVEKAGAGV